MATLVQHWQSFVRVYRQEIWNPAHLGALGPRGRLYAVLRVVSITLKGIEESRALSRAAALSFSSLLGLGPLVAIAMLVAGFMLDKEDPNLAVNTLNRLIKFIAPQIAEYERLTDSDEPIVTERSDILAATNLNQPKPAPPPQPRTTPAPAAANSTTTDATAPPGDDVEDAGDPEPELAVRPELVELIDGFVSGSRSGAVGALGALALIVIVIQLFTSIETAFNDIWGVSAGRSWLMRVVFYWTVLTLGAVLFFAAVTGIFTGTLFNAFAERMPFGRELLEFMRLLLPAGSMVVLIAILTIFYRVIPNTHVYWRAAFIGAVVVAVLLLLNNFLAFLYFRRVVLSRSLYGSLGVLPILMFGLYIFWLFVLLGGHVSYAIQNARFRNSQAAWNHLAESMRERLSLIVLLNVCRRFHNCEPPCTASELGKMLQVPTQLLNECLNRLVKMRLLTPIPPPPGEATDDRYQPARPLNRITLREFKTLDDDFGDDPAGPSIAVLDPIVDRYNAATAAFTHSELFEKSLEQLLDEHPDKTSRPSLTFDDESDPTPAPQAG